MATQLEAIDLTLRRKLLARLGSYFDCGFRDPELLYTGGRLAASMGMVGEACRYLDVLEEMLDGSSRSHAAVTLLRSSTAAGVGSDGSLQEQLRQLASSAPEIERLLSEIDGYSGNGTVGRILTALKDGDEEVLGPLLAEYCSGKDVQDEVRDASGIIRVQANAELAAQAYARSQSASSRYALEQMLLIDGNQPDVLHNLITVTSEQKDLEGYERYWRRYVTLLLWRIHQGEDADCAWADLTDFYCRVADLTERDVASKSGDAVAALLRRPGFIPRWLEAHSALAWMEAARRSRLIWQTGLSSDDMKLGRDGYLSLMQLWLHIFYPELEPAFGGYKNKAEPFVPMPSGECRTCLSFDPVERLLRRFIEWSRLRFGINEEAASDHRHEQSLLALCWIITRMPCEYYFSDSVIKDSIPDGSELFGTSVRAAIQDGCSLVLYRFSMSDLLDQQDWRGIVRLFADPEVVEKISPTLRMYVAHALCCEQRPVDALKLACGAVQDIPTSEFEADSVNHNIWLGILQAGISSLQGTPDSSDTLREQISSIPDTDNLVAVKAEALQIIDEHTVMAQIQELVAKGDFNGALAAVDSLPASSGGLKENLLQQLAEAEEHARIKKQVESAIKQCSELVQKDDYEGARKVINALPSAAEEVKKEALGQIREAESHYKDQKLIDQTIKKIESCLQNGNLAGAFQAIEAMPSSLAEVKQSLQKQIVDIMKRSM